MGWKIEPSFPLPVGFELYQDCDFLELHKCGSVVAYFNQGCATVSAIKAAIKKVK